MISRSGSKRDALVLLCLLGAAALLGGGCADNEGLPAGPDGYDMAAMSRVAGARNDFSGRGAHNDYPLEEGRWWTYAGSLSIGLKGEDPVVNQVARYHFIWGTEELFGRTYVVESEEIDVGGPGGGNYWIRYRQDRNGLYEADYPTLRPPEGYGEARDGERLVLGGSEEAWMRSSDAVAAGIAPDDLPAFLEARERLLAKVRAVEALGRSAAGPRGAGRGGSGVLPGELTRLAYPLRPGMEWTIREDPFFGSRVECRERIDTPSGPVSCFRISITSDLFGASDEVWLWYGREGLVGRSAHLESVFTGPSGEPGDTLVSDEIFLLSGHGTEEASALDLPGGVAPPRKKGYHRR